jgi:hypothetical protein
MSVFYNSFCLPGNRRDEVRASLQRWLHGRGFELSEERMLFDLDGETERSAFLIWNERWTVLVFSKYEEELRLLRELRTWAPRILYLWVQDSDVWGYDLVRGDGFAASFSSDPKLYRSFADAEEVRPAADPEAVCRILELPGLAAQLHALQRRRSVFAEDDCAGLCALLGLEAAAVSYDDLERGQVDGLEGWQVEQLLFYHPDSIAPPACGTDLHRIALGGIGATLPGVASQSQITPDILAELETLRRRARLRMLLLRPVSWLAWSWRWVRERLAWRSAVHRSGAYLPLTGGFEPLTDAGVGAELFNDRHRSWITPAPGLVPQPTSGKPALVWSFRAGRLPVTCTSRRRWKIADVLRPPRGAEVLRDEKYRLLSGLAARHLLFELPARYMAGTTDPSYLGLHVVDTRQALYVFLYRSAKPVEPDVEDAVRQTVMSFHLDEPAPRRS